MAVACPSRGTDNLDGSKFCNECATPLVRSPVRPPRNTRSSPLFCDLVGFTAISEFADPEDLDKMLASYFAMVRSQIERQGGVVEKSSGMRSSGLRRAGRSRQGRPRASPGRSARTLWLRLRPAVSDRQSCYARCYPEPSFGAEIVASSSAILAIPAHRLK